MFYICSPNLGALYPDMKLSQFKFELPEKLIAQEPLKTRHESRLMVVDRKTRTIEHKMFHDVLDIFNEDDVFVVNDTKVFTARMYGQKEKTGAQIEVFLLRELNHELRLWDVLVDPARKIRVGNKLYFGDDDLVAEVVDNTTSRGRTIRFLFDGDDEAFDRVVKKLGETPIPKYIDRAVKPEDEQWYQSLFAKNVGAVAAPAAQLHFTRELLMRMDIKGINFTNVTLHLGLGAFRDVEVEDLTKHKMDSEYYRITQETCDTVNSALENPVLMAIFAFPSSMGVCVWAKPGKCGKAPRMPPFRFLHSSSVSSEEQMAILGAGEVNGLNPALTLFSK